MPIADNIFQAVADTFLNPSEAQRAAGNYRKGKLNFHGLTISIETPKGQRRKPEWKPLAAHYGYVNRTKGRDGDHVDVFVGPRLDSEIVFVVDQVTPGGRFDEHKVVLACTSKKRAKQLYLANYPSGWKCGPITAMTVEQFKAWLAKGDTTRRVAEQVSRYDKSAGISGVQGVGTQNVDIRSATHQVGETRSWNGKTYRLNENHRWELADPDEEANQQQPGGEQQSPAQDQAARNKFTQSRLGTVHPELGGLMRAIHESPHFQQSGEFASFDVHQKVAGDLHHSLSIRKGQEFGGGQVVDLGEGRVGFASEAGSVVVWPADERGKHRVSYTNKTGIVGRAMAKDGNEGAAEGTAATGGTDQPPEQVSEPEPVPPPRPGIPRGKPVEQQQPAPVAGGKLPDEQAYDRELTPPKEKPAHVRLRARANQSKQRMEAALAEHEQAVEDRERPDRIRKLRQRFSDYRQVYNEHHRQATRAEAGHKARLKDSGKSTKERMKQLGIGPYKPKPKAEKPPRPGKEPKQPKEKPAKSPPAEKPAPLLDHAEKNPGKGDVPEATPEAMEAAKEMGKLPGESQRAGAAAQTYLRLSGLTESPENHKLVQHAIRRGWVKNKKELRAMLRRAKILHGKAGPDASDHESLREAIRRKANRERRESWASIVKEQAAAWDMTPQDYHQLASERYQEFAAPHKERENVKNSLRNLLKINSRKIRQIEERGGKGSKGGDYSTVKGMDEAARFLEEQFPHLIEDENPEQSAWDLLKEGRKQPPGKTSQEFTDHMGEFLQRGLGGGEGMSAEELRRLEEENAATPFAKVRTGVVLRY